MIVIVCLDDRKGMLFHERRQSRDRRVVERIGEIAKGERLWVEPFSVNLFKEMPPENLAADVDFLSKAREGEYCFVENRPLREVESNVEKLIVFWWNRRYPADLYLDLNLDAWTKVSEHEFSGYSHEKITEAVYRRM